MRSASSVFMSRTEAISSLPQIVGCEEKNGRSKGYKGSTLMQAVVGEKAHLGTNQRWLVKKSSL